MLPPPQKAVIPVINVVTAKGWPPDVSPTPADGLTVNAFARGLDHPRWIYVLPNGDVLVAETNAPRRPDDNKGIKGIFFKFFQARAGGAVPSANRITLLRDTDGDGVADIRSPFLTDLRSPFGMALVGDAFYVANTDALVRFPYTAGTSRISAAGRIVTGLPAGRINRHWTKNVMPALTGRNSTSRSAPQQRWRERHWQRGAPCGDLGSRSSDRPHRIFASGCVIHRACVGPETRKLWTAVNERDELGSDLVPDYITSVRDGGFYGFPYSYFGAHIDSRVQPQRPDLVARSIVPDYAVGAHTASLGLAWSGSRSLPARFTGGMFIGQHGSWNRKPRSGDRVVFVPFARGMPAGRPVDVLTGFVRENGEAMGRPVGVAIDRSGALLVADDVGNVIWRVAARSH